MFGAFREFLNSFGHNNQHKSCTDDSSLPDCPILNRRGTVDGSDAADQVLTGSCKANTFFISTIADSGQDTITNFGSNDVFVTDKKMFDSNNDGFVGFGSNDLLNIDFSLPGRGDDTVDLIDVDARPGLRYLGESCPGIHVYADGSVRPKGATESLLGDSALAGDVGDASSQVFFFDNALKIDLGNDTITSFGTNDLIVTTKRVADCSWGGVVNFGRDKTLDLGSGSEVVINNKAVTKLEFDGVVTNDGVDYYVYSRVGSTSAGVEDVLFV